MILIIAGIALLFIVLSRKKTETGPAPETSRTKPLGKMLLTWETRGCDKHGCGHFGADRARLGRGLGTKHEGQDYKAYPGDVVFAPADGKYIRSAIPYPGDDKYKGMLLDVAGFELKIFYVNPSLSSGATFKKGDGIGTVQNLAPKYEGITNHVHIEVRKNGSLLDPMEVIA